MCKTPAAKFSISMNPELLARVDDYCSTNFQSRSGLISIAVKQYLESADLVTQFGKMADALGELKQVALEQQQQQANK